MRKVLAVFVFAAASAMAADFTGYIVDANCAAKQGAKAASDDHAACAIDPAHLLGASGLVDPKSLEIGADARERRGGDRK